MSTQAPICIPGLTASADCSAKQYHFVEMTAARTITFCGAITDKAIGVLQNDPISGGAATVAAFGTTKVVAGAAIAAGALVAPTTAGKAQTAVSTQVPRGIAIDAAGADGDVIEILLVAFPAALA